MTVYEVKCEGRSRWDDYDRSISLYFKSKELASAYVNYMEDKYSDYIDDVMECEKMLEENMRSSFPYMKLERLIDIEEMLIREFGFIIPKYYIDSVHVYDYIPLD